jgi:hypothetical protein
VVEYVLYNLYMYTVHCTVHAGQVIYMHPVIKSGWPYANSLLAFYSLTHRSHKAHQLPAADTRTQQEPYTDNLVVFLGPPVLYTAKTKYRKISKQILPEKEYRGLCPNFHIHASVSDFYIPTIGLPILLEEICRPILRLNKSLADTSMWKLGLRPRSSQKRNT